MTSPTRQRLLAALFVAVALFHLLPIWRVHFIPTQDGPSHLYNAMVLRELAAGTPEFTRVFTIDTRPHPNWLTHAMLWAALYVVPPLVAEKLVFSAIVLLFLLGCWRLAGVVDERNRVYAFLVMPLAFHLLLQTGFYNYSMGVALVPWAIAACWRGSRVATAIWLLLCYFAHIVPATIALLACGVIWLIALKREGRSAWTRALSFVPTALLIVWFVLQPERPGGTWTWEGSWLWAPLAKVMLLFTFDLRQLTLGTALGITLGLLIVATIAFETIDRRRLGVIVIPRDTFLLLTTIAVILYLAAPISIEEGLVLKARLLIFPYLFVLPWLTPRTARLPLAIVLALVAITNVLFLRNEWKRVDQDFSRVVAAMKGSASVAQSFDAAQTSNAAQSSSAVKPLQTFVPLIFDRTTPHSHLPLLGHAISYAAIDHRLVDLANYEANLGFFPVAFRPDLRRPSILEVETNPGALDPAAWADSVDLIATWKLPQDSPLESRLLEHYNVVARTGEARLYRRRK